MDLKLCLSHLGKNRLNMDESKVLRKIFSHKSEEGTRDWRKLC